MPSCKIEYKAYYEIGKHKGFEVVKCDVVISFAALKTICRTNLIHKIGTLPLEFDSFIIMETNFIYSK